MGGRFWPPETINYFLKIFYSYNLMPNLGMEEIVGTLMLSCL